MWQLGDIHEKLGNHGKAWSVGFVGLWLVQKMVINLIHGYPILLLYTNSRFFDQFEDLYMYILYFNKDIYIIYIYIFCIYLPKSSSRPCFAMLVAKGMRNT